MALIGGFAGALIGEYYIQKRIELDIDRWFGERKGPPAKIMALVKPKGRDDV
jgi:cytosine/uracil/thiamine/allantoin permease